MKKKKKNYIVRKFGVTRERVKAEDGGTSHDEIIPRAVTTISIHPFYSPTYLLRRNVPHL